MVCGGHVIAINTYNIIISDPSLAFLPFSKESCTLITPRLVMNSRRVVTEHYADKLTDYANKVMVGIPVASNVVFWCNLT